MSNENCPQGIRNAERIKALSDKWNDILASLINIEKKVTGRPSWSVVLLITGLSTLCVALIVAFVT